jgi:archaellum biogenesis ATPase FlaH
MIKNSKKSYLTLEEMLITSRNRPKPKYLFSGVKEKTFGLVFGPSKSGKTIFCENLAMSLACGMKEFFGFPLDGIPKKVLFVGLEEFWENRIERNKKQYDVLSEDEKDLIAKNYLFQPIDFTSKIIKNEDWKALRQMIIDSKAEVVFIDSITRMNPGKLENSADAEKVMQKLREICRVTGVTLICIHHTPKMGDNLINMDSIKGSSVFAQESDFAIAVTQTPKKIRYVKTVFFRYASDDDETVKEFLINPSCWLDFSGDINEMELINKKDRRRNDGNRVKVVEFLDQQTCNTIKTSDLVSHITTTLSVKERQAKSYLSELVRENKIANPSQGCYISNKCMDENKKEDEK